MSPLARRRIGRPLRSYVDTSVFGGLHDDEFRTATERFFAAVRAGRIVVLVSPATADEIAAAPVMVRGTFVRSPLEVA
jgi:hypothetical protein